MIITIIANHRGLTDAAAVGIVEKIISFLFLVPSSMLSTVSALGAQNIGAGKHDRVDAILRYAIGIGLTFGLIVVSSSAVNCTVDGAALHLGRGCGAGRCILHPGLYF